MNKNITIGVLIAIVALTGFLAFKSPSVVQVPTSIKLDLSQLGAQKAPVVNVPAPIVNVAAPSVRVEVPRQEAVLGAVGNPDISSPYFSFGGVRFWAYKTSLPTTQASTSCSIAAPFGTSTIVSASYNINSLGSTTLTAIGWSAGPMATTTLISPTGAQQAVGTPQPVSASSTALQFVVPPSTRDSNGNAIGSFINFKLTPGMTVAPTGTCSVVFRQLE